MEKSKEYYAFISYKREDEKWAKWLQDKLEHYKFPTNLNGRSDLPKTIRPTFRDVTDLEPGLLAEKIDTALRNSKWLIVVCSPRSAKSPWVCKEAQTFIDLGRADHIIPFVIEGNPFSNDTATECYPEALLNLTGSQELLAANINEMGRDAAAIKVVARMFNLRFDALWQRYEREQRRKKWIWIGGAIFIALLGIFIGSYFVRQNGVIEKQKNQLQSLVSNLKEEKNTYSQLQDDRKQYVYIGELRGMCYGRVSQLKFHPYESLIVFSDDWGIWLHYLNTNLEVQLPTSVIPSVVDAVDDFYFSADGTEVMAKGYQDIVYIWNIESCKLIGYYCGEDYDRFIESQEYKDKFLKRNNEATDTVGEILLKNNEFTCNDGRISIFDNTSKKVVCSTEFVYNEDSTLLRLINSLYHEILFITDKRAALYDDTKKEFVLFFKDYQDTSDIEFDESGEFLRVGSALYARTIKKDTIQQKEYTVHPIKEFPIFTTNKDSQYDEATKASLTTLEKSILYKRENHVTKINVDMLNFGGNGGETLVNAIFAGSNKVVAIVHQGNLRVYNPDTGKLMGMLETYEWDNPDKSIGHERSLCHAESYIVGANYINKRLYVLSSGGILRIYNVDRMRLDTVIELPLNEELSKSDGPHIGPVVKYHITNNASHIYYSFEEDSIYYVCEIPYIR